MKTIIDNARIFSRLSQTWQPVAISRDFTVGTIKNVQLLDQDIIIAHLPDGMLAAPDHCPHRGAKFALGDIHNKHLRCPYHGWEFDHNGKCKKIPSLADQNHSALHSHSACMKNFSIQERYGMIWVRLDTKEIMELPDIPEFESDDWEFVIADPMEFGVGFRREVDNYLDMSHFAFAHSKSLGVAAQEIIDDVRITHYRDGLQMDAPFPFVSSSEIQPGKLQQAHQRCQRIYLPNFTTIRQSFHDGDERVLVHIPSPHSEESCTVYWALAINKGFNGPPIAEQIKFAINVLDEDRIMVENQRPLEVQLGAEEGANVPADRLCISYKRAIREFIESDAVIQRVTQAQQGGPHPIAICWGSQTGNCERLANSVQFALEDAGIHSDIFEFATLNPSDLKPYQLAIIITSTYGNGNPPDNTLGFHQSLQKQDSTELNDLNFAVCALGDKKYPKFCQCGKDLDQFFENAGATRLLKRVDCDADYSDAFAAWLQQLQKSVDKLLGARV